MRNIKEGDTVTAYWINSERCTGIVENTPQDVGDLWYISAVNASGDKTIRAINPLCSEFDSFVKIEKHD